MPVYDVAIIGAGPAGLAAVQKLKGKGLRVVLIDNGKAIHERDKDNLVEITEGHGGAGLFSDGKFSFFPSASALWELPNGRELRQAYEWTCTTLNEYGLDTPPFPTNPKEFTVGSGEWVLKDYPSNYMSLESRINLVENMVQTADADIITQTKFLSYEHNIEKNSIIMSLRDENAIIYHIECRRIILASGRFGPLEMTNQIEKQSFNRLEVGFRIEQQEDLAFFKNMKQLDPKLKFQSDDGIVEWRTFCACRDGETVLTKTQDLWTVSGHSDGPSTGRSNVGFNTRILNKDIADRALSNVVSAMKQKDSYFRIKVQDVLARNAHIIAQLVSLYGEELFDKMLQGLRNIIKRFPEIDHENTYIVGPTLEGVGWYPSLDGDLSLETSPSPVWVAGDACGIFRGIVAAMISGHYAASSVLKTLEAETA
ncbi:FAD-dependent oxidoreductase [Photorhabdus tasmaniensis]|uniref:FAD-dependent oxidoreductase n=1 Tax=Photorhabdus tasmaniensis TaxID=1004159 RepID=UPI004042ADD4